MRRWAKVLARILIVVVAMPLLFGAAIYASAWYYRGQAEKLLSVLKTVRPGVTTQTEYLRLIHPFEAASYEVRVDDKVLPGALAIGNRPELIQHVLRVREGLLDRLLSWHVIPPLAAFSVTPSYQNGVVWRLYLDNETPITGHAPGAFVRWAALRYEADGAEFQGPFSGYRMSQMGVAGGPPWEFFVSLDERATSDEAKHALDFRFECFTEIRGCSDAREYLQPAPDRTTPDDIDE